MFYAVRVGKQPGIYDNWTECKKNVNGFKRAEFHKFKTLNEAEEYLYQNEYKMNNHTDDLGINLPYAFVDGSYNPKTKFYGYGGILKYKNEYSDIKTLEITGSGNDLELSIMRNISGELLAAIHAIEKAIELKLSEINIYYDYLGIEMWANKQWGTNKKFVKEYIEFIEESRKSIKINFFKVQAHSGVEENEFVDKLAKKSVGVI